MVIYNGRIRRKIILNKQKWLDIRKTCDKMAVFPLLLTQLLAPVFWVVCIRAIVFSPMQKKMEDILHQVLSDSW